MRCSSCGAEAAGNFCASCGAPLSKGKRACSRCGGELKAGQAFCSSCGQPAGPRQRKPFSAHLPWVISFVLLAAFALGIAFFVQRQARARIGDDPITGGLPESGSPAGEGAAGMPDIASMSPREAADRLFDRAMREDEEGNEDQASLFANMALQAYGRVPRGQMDLDALFHVGLLHLAIGDAGTAGAMADGLLAEDENHLLGLLLARRAAVASEDPAAAEGYVSRLQAAVAAGELDRAGRPEYQAHRSLIEREAGVAPPAGAMEQQPASPEGAGTAGGS